MGKKQKQQKFLKCEFSQGWKLKYRKVIFLKLITRD